VDCGVAREPLGLEWRRDGNGLRPGEYDETLSRSVGQHLLRHIGHRPSNEFTGPAGRSKTPGEACLHMARQKDEQSTTLLDSNISQEYQPYLHPMPKERVLSLPRKPIQAEKKKRERSSSQTAITPITP
jgi:hypothetical protein